MARAYSDGDARVRRRSAGQNWVTSSGQAYPLGLARHDIRTRRRRGEWAGLFRGVYLIDPDVGAGAGPPRLAVIRAGTLAAGPNAVVVRHTAAELLGLPGVPREVTVHLSLPTPEVRHRQVGLAYHQLAFEPDHINLVHGLRVTTVVRTIADLVLLLGRLEAVAMLDGALHAGVIDDCDLDVCLDLIRGRPGCVAGRRHLAACDGRAESPAETRVRLICSEGGLPTPLLQYPVLNDFGDLLGYADLAWPKARVAAEVDGAGPHGRPGALFRDRHRQNDLMNAGWTVIRFTWADTYHPAYIVSTVRRALAAGADRRAGRS